MTVLKTILSKAFALWELARQHRNAELVWSMPPVAQVVILDACASEELVPLLSGASFVTIYTRGERLYLSPRIVFAAARNIFKLPNPLSAYALALVECVKPKLVLTFIDNSGVYHAIKPHYPRARFMAIQNGIRCLSRDNPGGKPAINHGHFVCFGQSEIDAYRHHGAKVDEYHPFGSLRDAYYQACRLPPLDQRFDICLVSEADMGLAKAYPEIEAAIRRLAGMVARYCEESGRTFCVACRNHPYDQPDAYAFEVEWLHMIFGGNPVLLPNVRTEFTSYRAIDASTVSISCCSTLLREAFGRGRRVLFANFTGDPNYDLPCPGLWSVGSIDYATFSARLSLLLNMSDKDFAENSHAAATHMMARDIVQPVQSRIAALIASLLRP